MSFTLGSKPAVGAAPRQIRYRLTSAICGVNSVPVLLTLYALCTALCVDSTQMKALYVFQIGFSVISFGLVGHTFRLQDDITRHITQAGTCQYMYDVLQPLASLVLILIGAFVKLARTTILAPPIRTTLVNWPLRI